MTERIEKSYAPFEYKFLDAGGEPAGTFEGYGAAFNNIDEGRDRLLPGSFLDTLAQSKASGKMPKMLLNHGGLAPGMIPGPDDLLPIGKWNTMSEDTRGLQVKGRLINLDTESGKRIHGAMREGELDSLSMGYKALKFVRGTRTGEPARTISAVKLFEVSPVTFSMNGLATINSVKSLENIKTIREFEDFLRDVGGYSNAAAKSIAARGFKAQASDPRDEDGIGEAIAGPFAALAKLIRS